AGQFIVGHGCPSMNPRSDAFADGYPRKRARARGTLSLPTFFGQAKKVGRARASECAMKSMEDTLLP
ncbi:MAG: hypothetical protein D6717_02420, partial [Gammaproteobacteria bacterium]